MLSKIKSYIYKDVDNPNETSEGAIAIRICSIAIILYLFFLTTVLLLAKQAEMILYNVIFIMLFCCIFTLTYKDRTKAASIYFNLATIGFVCFNVIYLGWNIGIQHFLFMLILLDLIFTYIDKRIQFLTTVVLCVIRLLLYFYCNTYESSIKMYGVLNPSLQIITTICVFLLIYLCGLMLSSDTQNMERKLIAYNNELNELANTDALTKLWNRLHLMRYIEQKIKEPYQFLSIAIGDIDFFKKVNDTYGHDGGDEVLKKIAAVFREKMNGNGIVARWGGEEFIFVFENANGDDAYKKLSELQHAIKNTVISYNNIDIKITMTFGLVEFDHKLSLDENISIADKRLYRGKKEGRDRIIY